METEVEKKPYPLWKIKFVVAMIMLILAFVGMIFIITKSDDAWIYWSIIALIYALLCIGLSLYLRHKNIPTLSTFWHEIFHWAALVGSVYLVTLLVPSMVSRYVAGIVVMVLLAFSTFLSGIYTERTFLVIGLLLALIVLGMTFIGYFFIPIAIVAILLLFWISRR